MTVAPNDSLLSSIKTWINDHLEQGHSPESIIESMANDGVDKDAAAAAVHALLRGEMPDPLPYEYDRIPVSPDRVVHVHDRTIHALLRVERPQMVLFDNVLSADECDQIIEISENRLQPSATIDPASGRLEEAETRTSESLMLRISENPVIDTVDRRISALMNRPLECGEGLQVVRYRTGGQYLRHFDFYSPRDSDSITHLTGGGQRTATLIVYLNDVEAGGETYFPEPGVSFSPRKGQAVYFRYFNNRGQLDPATLHAGLPVLAGEKWIINKWMRRYPVPR
ncbi:2OG-Fe(II) oxygenase [Nocardia rhamnosiphila]|uniref:2OG-Fe(II) oxygenase n=1 Tax=Nocardia rhamnosiphila TaxID=426716 RepID=A0ABV2WSU6_9NOCA